MTENKLLSLLQQNPEQAQGLLSGLDHATLYQMRSRAPNAMQGLLSPMEHRAFAREVVADNPLMSVPVAAAIPLYQAYKAIMGARSAPSLDQVGEAYTGIGEGLRNYFRK